MLPDRLAKEVRRVRDRRAADVDPQVIGHRGDPSQAVENSIAGLRAAEGAGADLVEMDIQETADGGCPYGSCQAAEEGRVS